MLKPALREKTIKALLSFPDHLLRMARAIDGVEFSALFFFGLENAPLCRAIILTHLASFSLENLGFQSG